MVIYLEWIPFAVYAYDAALTWIVNIAEPPGWLISVFLRLGELYFRIEDKQGINN